VSSKPTHSSQLSTARQIEPFDPELLSHIEKVLYTAVLSDALDEIGVHDRAMREHLRPLAPDVAFAGRAKTILCMDMHYIPDSPYTLEIEAVDSILPGEVVVVATGVSVRNAPWGELLSTAAIARGARGAVIDGLVRDVKKILNLGFPVFAAGIKPVDSRGRGAVVNYDIPIECGGVTVTPGDLIVADFDGVVAIPASVTNEVVRLATEKVTRENGSRAELMAGKYLRDVYEKYGVL
jgi:4-hydroxy-4-methyl-2-oxoglutarate aldolase